MIHHRQSGGVHPTPWQCTLSHACHAKATGRAAETKGRQRDTGAYIRPLGSAHGSGIVCARQTWVVCARQTLIVCARLFFVILSLYLNLCNMILLVVFFFTSSYNSSLCGFFLTSLCGVFVFRLAFRAFSSFSSSVVPPLTQLHPSSLTLNSHNSSHSTHLTQLISHNSTHSSAAFVWHLVELFFHTTHLTTHTTHLTQLLSSHNSHNSSHTTQLTQELLSCSIWWSCFRVAGSALAAGVALVWQAREFDFLQAAARGAPGAASACYGDCRRALGLNSFHKTQMAESSDDLSPWIPPLFPASMTFLSPPHPPNQTRNGWFPASMCADDRSMCSICADDPVSLCADDSFAMCADDRFQCAQMTR